MAARIPKKKAAKKRAAVPSVPDRALRMSPKFEERRAELADAALVTLADLGYSRTSLREIAQNTDYSHGVLHYYFADKVELITYCVKQYKAACVRRYDEIVSTARSAHELERRFGAGMSQTMREDAKLHRLWYDLRSQSLFEPSLREDVEIIDDTLRRMIWRIVERYAELTGEPPRVGSALAYAMFDGVFQHGLNRQLTGDTKASADLEDQVVHILRSASAPAIRDVTTVARPAKRTAR